MDRWIDEKDLFKSNTITQKAYLIRTSTGASTELVNEQYTLGKSSDAGIQIKGNGAVSRLHAHIFRSAGAYFIEDMNSLNHTYVDNNMITGPVQLWSGAVVKLANEEFVFRLENIVW